MARKEQRSVKNQKKQKGDFVKHKPMTPYQLERAEAKKRKKGAGTNSILA